MVSAVTGFQLAASLVESLAWPIAALILGVVLRKPIGGWLSSLAAGRQVKRAKVGPVEIEWENLDEARAEVAKEASESGTTSLGARTGEGELADLVPLAESHPTAAVMLAFQRLERALTQALKAHLGSYEKPRSLRQLVDLGYRQGVLPGDLAAAVHDLRVVRNQVAHAVEPSEAGVTPARAVDYVATTQAIIGALKRPEPQ